MELHAKQIKALNRKNSGLWPRAQSLSSAIQTPHRVLQRVSWSAQEDAFMTIKAVSVGVLGLALFFASACATDYLRLATQSVEKEQYESAVDYLKQGG